MKYLHIYISCVYVCLCVFGRAYNVILLSKTFASNYYFMMDAIQNIPTEHKHTHTYARQKEKRKWVDFNSSSNNKEHYVFSMPF